MQIRLNILWVPILTLSFVFLFFGIDKFVNPEYWMGWTPSWMIGLFGLTAETINTVSGFTEIALALFLLHPKTRFVGSLGMALLLLFIIVAMTRFSATGIRDIGILGMASYIFLCSYLQLDKK